MMTIGSNPRALPMAVGVAALLLAAESVRLQEAAAIDTCRVSVSRTDGTVSVFARNVVGQPYWGYRSEEVDEQFANESTCLGGNALNGCELALPGEPERYGVSHECRLYLRDDVSACSAYVRGCTPTVGTQPLAPNPNRVFTYRDLSCASSTQPCWHYTGTPTSAYFCSVAGFQWERVQIENDQVCNQAAECRVCNVDDVNQWCCGGLGGGEAGSREVELVVNCGELDFDEQEFRIPDEVRVTLSPNDLRGGGSCEYGTDCNVCVDDVLGSFRALDTGRRDGRLMTFSGAGEVDINGHMQGAARIPGVGNENWLVASKGGGDVMAVRFSSVVSTGGSWASAGGGAGHVVHAFRDAAIDHPGGMQAIGRHLAIGMEGPGRPEIAEVRIYDLGNLVTDGFGQPISTLRLDGSQNEPNQGLGELGGDTNPGAAFVSIAKLADGRYLLFIASNRSAHGWIYRSVGSTLHGAQWQYLQAWKGPTVQDVGWWPARRSPERGIIRKKRIRDKSYQAGSFITECGTQRLYWIGMRKYKGLRKDKMEIYEVSATRPGEGQGPAGRFLLRRRGSKTVVSHFQGCSMRAGGSIHTTPGRNMLVYCIRKQNGLLGKFGSMAIEEFRE